MLGLFTENGIYFELNKTFYVPKKNPGLLQMIFIETFSSYSFIILGHSDACWLEDDDMSSKSSQHELNISSISLDNRTSNIIHSHNPSLHQVKFKNYSFKSIKLCYFINKLI